MPGSTRFSVSPTPPELRAVRFPHILGTVKPLRHKDAAQRIAFLQGRGGRAPRGVRRFLSFRPGTPRRGEPFEVEVKVPQLGGAKVSLVTLAVRFPSGVDRELSYRPKGRERTAGPIRISGLNSGCAGELCVAARLYLSDGRCLSDARLASVLSRNPCQLVVTPKLWLVSGRAGRVEYDFDREEYHCRAYGTLTNGGSTAVTFNRFHLRVTDGGIDGTVVDEAGGEIAPFVLHPGQPLSATIDTWFPKGNPVWVRFSKLWDLTFSFAFESVSGVRVSDPAVYLPMAAVPVNIIACADFTNEQIQAEHDAVTVATELLEQRDITLYDPKWQVLASEQDKGRFCLLEIGWQDGDYTYGEGGDLLEAVSGPDQERLDVFVPQGFEYTDDVPQDRRDLGGFSVVNGPVPKDDRPRSSGCVSLLHDSDPQFFGQAIAHEIGHYLGLEHEMEDENNLMYPSGVLTLTWDQWNTLRQHGMVKGFLPGV